MTEEKRNEIKTKHTKQRYPVFDTLRGLTLLSMLFYHGIWDLVYLYGFDWQWYKGEYAYIWQQSICWSFILLSGFCFLFGKHHLKRGLLVTAAGFLITVITIVFMWEERVVFGVLTLLGCAMLLMIPLDKGVHAIEKLCAGKEKLINGIGIVISFGMFILTKNINIGYLGFDSWKFCRLPQCLYQNTLTAFFGFPGEHFFSTDYFSLLPWFFLFAGGYFLHGIIMKNRTDGKWLQFCIKPLEYMGKHSLILYMVHQPVLYALFWLLFGH